MSIQNAVARSVIRGAGSLRTNDKLQANKSYGSYVNKIWSEYKVLPTRHMHQQKKVCTFCSFPGMERKLLFEDTPGDGVDRVCEGDGQSLRTLQIRSK